RVSTGAMQHSATRIGAGNFHHRVDLPQGDGLAGLAAAFNRMAARLQDAHAKLQQEVDARGRDLTEALEQQTATSEILRVISRSPTDLQPVFDAIAERAMRLCGASSSAVTRFDGELVHVAALAHVNPEAAAAIRSVFPMPPSPRGAHARAILTNSVVHIPDVLEDPEYGIATQAQTAFRSAVAVPMLHEGKAIGVVGVG